MTIHVGPEVLVVSVFRVAMYLMVLGVGWRLRSRQHWPVGVACVLGIASNGLLVTGYLTAQAIVGIPFVALTAWIFIDRMRSNPHLIRALLGSKESAWSQERHELLSEIHAARAHAKYLRDKYEPEAS